MTAERMLRGIAVAAAMAASVILAATPAVAADTRAASVQQTTTETPPQTPPPIPDDPNDPERALEYWLDGAKIRQAWNVTRGKGVRIAIIDTGIGKPPSSSTALSPMAPTSLASGARTGARPSACATPTTGHGSRRSPRDGGIPTGRG
ncbi:hypothetical protein [Microbacterium esteraromaticum]|uniref:hypothetical protein n=1 Tax=Microbacterium esteraromaticum TaxID=57043 RepID=UPI0031FD45E5